MVVKFLEFEEVNEGALHDDLEIINGDLPPVSEDLTETPFIQTPKRKPAFKPPPPNTEERVIAEQQEVEDEEEEHIYIAEQKVKKIKAKKPLSEKQKAHLEKMRLKKANKKKEQIEKTMEKRDIVSKVKMEAPKELTEEEILDMDKKEFNKWIKYMDRFEKMVDAMEKQKQREVEKIRKEEEILEARIRKKIEMENKQRSNKKHDIPDYSNINNNPALENKENEYGEYSSFFGY